MKSFVISLVIAFIIFMSGFFSSNYLKNTSSRLININNKIYENILSNSYDQALKEANNASSYIDNNYYILASLIDHAQIDKIQINLNYLTVFLSEKRKVESLCYTNVLSTLYEHLYKTHEIKLENIL